MNWLDTSKTIAAAALATLTGTLYGFAPSFSLGEYHQILLEAMTLAITAVVGAVVGAALEVCRISKTRSERLISILGSLLTSVIVLIVGAYTMVHYFGVPEFSVAEAILKAATLVVLIVIGTMLGVKFGIQRGVLSIGDAANASRDIRRTRNITAAALTRWLGGIAYLFLILTLVVVALPLSNLPAYLAPTDSPTRQVSGDALFTASATLLGLALSGSALSTRGANKNLIKGTVYAFIPFVVVQIVFMMSLLEYVRFPAILWIVMTAILLMLLAFVIAANMITPARADSGTDPFRHS